MAWFRRPSTPTVTRDLRDVLFGDVPLAVWAGDGKTDPWRQFAEADACLSRHDAAGAAIALNRIVEMPALDSRHYLQAWHSLRALNRAPPPDVAKRVLGVVIEVALPAGLDVLAAYDDRTVRYLNARGGSTIWDHPNSTLDAQIDRVLHAGRELAARIGAWASERRGPPPTGYVRITMLTPSGPHFGEGPLKTLEHDALAGPALAAGAALLRSITQLTIR